MIYFGFGSRSRSWSRSWSWSRSGPWPYSYSGFKFCCWSCSYCGLNEGERMRRWVENKIKDGGE